MADRPWLKSYPENVVWDQKFEPFPLDTVLDTAVATYGDKPYMDFMDRVFTFREAGDMVRALARGLQDMGVGPGVKVGIFLPNCPQYILSYFAILKAGGTVVNFSPLYSEKELLYQIEDSETDYMVTMNSRMMVSRIDHVMAASRLKKAIVSDIADVIPFKRRLRLKIFARKEFLPVRDDATHVAFSTLLKTKGEPTPVEVGDLTQRIAVLQYTGGTTGVPKGAMLTHANLSINIQQGQAWDPTIEKGKARVLSVLPFFHAFGMTSLMLNGTVNGSLLVLQPRFDPDESIDLLIRKKVTHFPAVPTMYTALLGHPDADKADLSALQRCYSGGAPLPQELKGRIEARLEGVRVREGYGLTETSPLATANPTAGVQKPGSVGMPVPATDIRFSDPDDPAKFLPYGETGEIRIKGPQVMLGYWKRPEATAEAIINGWFRTGDVGYMDEDGYIFIVDRKKDMILVGGFNVFPRTIEEAILEHPSVQEVTVIGVPDQYLGEMPKAFVVLKKSTGSLGADELKAFLAERIGKHEMPREIEFRDSLPKTVVGKLSKKELAEEERAKYQEAEGGAGQAS